MRAELRALASVDVDLRSYIPEEEAFCITITAEIGAVGEAGADNFDFEVCYPQWLEAAGKRHGCQRSSHPLHVRLQSRGPGSIRGEASAPSGGTGLAFRSGKAWPLEPWEFEDYTP